MPTQAKIEIVDEIQSKFENSNSIYFADYKGLNVEKINQLRKSFLSKNVEYKVFKNNLTKIAAKNVGYKDLDDLLIGQIGIAFSKEDPTAPARVIKEFINEKNPLEVKGIIFEGKMFDANKYEELANLPSREELLSNFVGCLNSPMTKLVGTLNGAMSKLVGALNGLKEKKV